MAELTYTLGEHPQIKELLSVLEQNNLQKQKEEVQALVGYMDSLEGKLAQMMEEMKEMRLEVGKLHDKGIRARCAQLVTATEGTVCREVGCDPGGIAPGGKPHEKRRTRPCRQRSTAGSGVGGR